MDRKQGNLDGGKSAPGRGLYVAFELSNSTWKLACSDGNKLRHVTVTAGDLAHGVKRHFGIGDEVHTVSCYEAGRDGFWLHRYLHSCVIDNVVVDSASLEVNRRLRRAKTDRIDAGKLLSMLIRYHSGEKHLWRVVRVPSREDEDARHLHRELEALKRERTRYRNRLHGILIQQGLRVRNPSMKKFTKELDLIRTWDCRELPPEMKVRLVRVHERLRMVEEQISSLIKEKTQRLQEENARMAQVAQLLRLPGIGPVSSWTFVMEFFGWRRFREPTGALAIEIAWAWLRFQPQSKLNRWFLERFAGGGSRRYATRKARKKLGAVIYPTTRRGSGSASRFSTTRTHVPTKHDGLVPKHSASGTGGSTMDHGVVRVQTVISTLSSDDGKLQRSGENPGRLKQ